MLKVVILSSKSIKGDLLSLLFGILNREIRLKAEVEVHVEQKKNKCW